MYQILTSLSENRHFKKPKPTVKTDFSALPWKEIDGKRWHIFSTCWDVKDGKIWEKRATFFQFFLSLCYLKWENKNTKVIHANLMIEWFGFKTNIKEPLIFHYRFLVRKSSYHDMHRPNQHTLLCIAHMMWAEWYTFLQGALIMGIKAKINCQRFNETMKYPYFWR